MRGTLLCAVTDGEESADVLALGAELSERLGLRLVLAHAVDGSDDRGDGSGRMTMKRRRLAEELETETPVPVLIAPPRTQRGRNGAAMTEDDANVAP